MMRFKKLPNRQLLRIAHNEAGDKMDLPIRCVTVEYFYQDQEAQSPHAMNGPWRRYPRRFRRFAFSSRMVVSIAFRIER